MWRHMYHSRQRFGLYWSGHAKQIIQTPRAEVTKTTNKRYCSTQGSKTQATVWLESASHLLQILLDIHWCCCFPTHGAYTAHTRGCCQLPSIYSPHLHSHRQQICRQRPAQVLLHALSRSCHRRTKLCDLHSRLLRLLYHLHLPHRLSL